MCKVRPEAFLWGAGTALGELPPYFMAKASRLSGIDEDEDEDLKAVVELKRKKAAGDELTLFERLKLGMERVVERVGFFGILACASVSCLKVEGALVTFSLMNFSPVYRFRIRCSTWLASRAAISWYRFGHSSVPP